MAIAGADYNTKVAFKNCALFTNCRTKINDTFIDKAEYTDIAMPMYNLIEYGGNYSDTSGNLWQFTVDAQHIPNNSSSLSIYQALLQTEMM